ncbi:MAG TPA: PEP-CTERM sorting domain-containing protein [Tepidisphaeraceae bacterium]|nr:PEP-CTERM sorting domain-containing protein [Tepidisphaeraceae bacterium]
MQNTPTYRSINLCKRAFVGIAVLMAALSPRIASAIPAIPPAPLVFSAPTFSAEQGSSGSFDLLIENTGNDDLDVTTETVKLGVSGSGVHFTATDINTTAASYIFLNHSFDAASSATLDSTGAAYPKTDFSTLDIANVPGTGFTDILSFEIFGVVHVSYSIDADATLGDHNLTFEDTTGVGQGTSAGGLLGGEFRVSAINGILTVVPEPASIGLMMLAAPMLLRWRATR